MKQAGSTPWVRIAVILIGAYALIMVLVFIAQRLVSGSPG